LWFLNTPLLAAGSFIFPALGWWWFTPLHVGVKHIIAITGKSVPVKNLKEKGSESLPA